MNIILNHPDPAPLQRFLAEHPHASHGHDPRWLDVLRHAFNHRIFTLTAFQNDRVVAYLPLAESSSLLFGRRLTSLPYLDRAGLLASDDLAAHALIDRAAALARSRRARSLELRNASPFLSPALQPARTDKIRMTLDLPDSPQALWSQLSSKVRNQLRKAQSHNLATTFGSLDLLHDFYNVFATNMRDLGTPVFPARLFHAILSRFPDHAELCLVHHQHRPVAAALLLHHNHATHVPSASSLRPFNHTCANMHLYHALLNRAIQRRSASFDFGRSTLHSGPHAFKKQWGAKPHPTHWLHLPLHPHAKPLRADDDRFALAVRLWRQLPVWLTRLAGPPIVRGIP